VSEGPGVIARTPGRRKILRGYLFDIAHSDGPDGPERAP
jgi:hypothetical protein